LGGVSRLLRAGELRVADLQLEDAESVRLFRSIRGRKVNLVPLKERDAEARDQKARRIRRNHHIQGPLAFLNVRLLDNRSEFLASLKVRIRREGKDFVITAVGAVAVPNTVAYVSEILDPRTLFLSLTRRSLMSQSFRYLLWGEGEVGLEVYSILVKYWSWTPPGDLRPLLVLESH